MNSRIKNSTIAFVVFLSACTVFNPDSTDDGPDGATDTLDPFELDWDDRSIFEDGLVSGEQAVLKDSQELTTYHVDLEVAEDKLGLFGHLEAHYTNRELAPLNEVYFRLFPNIVGGGAAISELEVDGEAVEPTYEFGRSAMLVPLSDELDSGDSIVISMNFGVEIPTDMGGNYGLFGYFENVLVLNEFLPVIPSYDDEGWNVGFPHPNGDFPNYDVGYYVVRISAPDDLTIVSSGIQMGEVRSPGTQEVTFVAGPVRNYYFAASDQFIVINRTVGETTVNSYAMEGLEEGAQLASVVAGNALESFSTRFGQYPYTELDVVSTPMQALGMEYPGLTAIALGIYDLKGSLRGTSNEMMLESVVAHEVGHQYFFNVVGNDQSEEPWLDEAITQYITGLYFLDMYGSDGFIGSRGSWMDRWGRVNNEHIPIGLPAGEYSGLEYGAIVYGRGPLFLDRLAAELGQEPFDAFLREYYQTNKWQVVTSEDFHNLSEANCDCDLDDLFDEWVYR
jgi:hypothetical protein